MANAAKKIAKLDKELGKLLDRRGQLQEQLDGIDQQIQQTEDRRAESVRLAASGEADQAEVTRQDQEAQALQEQREVQRELIESLDREIEDKKLEIYRLEREAHNENKQKWKEEENQAWQQLYRSIAKIKACRLARGLDVDLAVGRGVANQIFMKALAQKREEGRSPGPASQHLSRSDRESLEKRIYGERPGITPAARGH